MWLGVVPYLTRTAIDATLRHIAGLPAPEVVFDYGEPPERHPPERRARVAAMDARVAAAGEPWITHFDPDELAAGLRDLGFTEIEDLGPDKLAARFFGAPADAAPRGAGPHVVRARRVA